MNNEFEQIKNAVKKIRLNDNEKEKMRAFVFEQIQSVETNRTNVATNSIVNRIREYFMTIKSYYSLPNKYRYVPAIAVFLIVILVGGTSAFAEMSVPGDFLYGIKVSVNEPLAGLFAFTKEEKTEWQERLVERRLSEAQKLVSENNLSEKKRIYLGNAIQKQVNNFNASADDLAKQKNESSNSSNINIRLQAALAAHQDILLATSNNNNISAETKQQAGQLLSILSESENSVKNGHNVLESLANEKQTTTSSGSGVASTPTEDMTAVQGKQKIALETLNSMKILYQKERANLSVSTENSIDGKLADAEGAIKDAETLAASSNFTEAANKFQSAIDSTDAARLLLLSSSIKSDIEDDIGIGNKNNHNSEEDDIDEEDGGLRNSNQNGSGPNRLIPDNSE